MDIEKIKNKIVENSIPEPNTGCWLWLGAPINKDRWGNGYGVITVYVGLQIFAHRLSYEVFVNKITPGKMICHKCNNKNCVNPDHLYEGDALSNAQDRVRSVRAKRRLKDPAYEWWLP